VNIRTGCEADGARMSVPKDVFIAIGVLNALGSVRAGGAERFSAVESVRHQAIPAFSSGDEFPPLVGMLASIR
jgi:hypothetical protein